MIIEQDSPIANAAGRALSILQRARASSKGRTLGELWKHVFQVNSAEEVRYRLCLLVMLLGEAHHRFQALCHEQQFDSNPFPELLHTLLHPQLGASPDDMLKKAKDAQIALAWVSSVQSNGATVQVPNDEKLLEWRQIVSQLMSDIRASQEDEPLREFLIEQLSGIWTALSLYEFHGPEGLQKELRSATYAIGRRWKSDIEPLVEPESTNGSESEPGIMRRALDLFADMNVTLELVKKSEWLLPAAGAIAASVA